MAARVSPASSDKYEPLPRFRHIAGCVDNKYIVQGGATQDSSEESKHNLSSVVELFDPFSEIWKQEPVKGDLPNPDTHAAASASLYDNFYCFGGTDGSHYFNTLYKLEAKSRSWILLSPQNTDGAPMPKRGCGMIILGDDIWVVGGYGIPRGPTDPESFMKNNHKHDGCGWTNELHSYNLSEGVWSCPTTNGERPPPCALFTFTAVDGRRAVMFGGSSRKHGLTDDVYLFNISTMNWRKLNKSGPWPEERAGNAACCLNYGQQFPQLLMTGGVDRQGRPLGDVWILDIEREKWRMENVTPKCRWYHSLTAISLGPGLTEVMEFGGADKPRTDSDTKQPKIADTTLLQFRLVESSGQSQWELLSVADYKQLGSQQRMMDKEKLLQWERERFGVAKEEKAEEGEEEQERDSEFIGEILAEKVVQVKTEEEEIGLDGYGLKIHIPTMALPEHAKQFLLQMAVSRTKDYQLPTEDGVLVSAIYSLDHSLGDRKFHQPITLQMQHCLKDVSGARLSIVRSDDRVPPYCFKAIPGGRFDEIGGYSIIDVDHFTTFSTFLYTIFGWGDPSFSYLAMLYYTNIKPGRFKFHLFIIQHLEATVEEVQHKMEKDYSGNFKKGTTAIIEIDKVFQLCLPKNAVSGWTMKHSNHKEMRRDVILNNKPHIPFQVRVKWTGLEGQRPEKLEYELPIGDPTKDLEIVIESPDECTECLEAFGSSISPTSSPSYHKTSHPGAAESGGKMETLYHSGLVESSGQSQRELLSVADNKQLGSQQRMMDKEKLLQWERERLGVAKEEEGEKEGKEERERDSEFIGEILVGKVVQVKMEEEEEIGLDGYGLKIHIPVMTPPEHAKQFLLQMAVSRTNDYQLPTESGVLVSAIYSLNHSLGDRKFRQPITLQMQHCLKDVSSARLSIVRSDDRVPPYRFKAIPGGRFDEIEGYSIITVDHFSTFSTFLYTIFGWGDPSISCLAMLYYTDIKPGSFKFHLFIIEHLEATVEEVKQEMEKDYGGNFKKGTIASIKIDEVFQFCLPEDAVSGWTMEHDNHQTISRDIILKKKPHIPFQVSVKWTGPEGQRPEKLERRLSIGNVKMKIESPDGCSGSSTNPRTVVVTIQDFSALPEPTLRQLMNVIGVDLQAKWRAVGLELGLENSLETINSNNIGYSNSCMSDVFSRWKCQMTRDYSWKTMAEVLCSRNVNTPALLPIMLDRIKSGTR